MRTGKHQNVKEHIAYLMMPNDADLTSAGVSAFMCVREYISICMYVCIGMPVHVTGHVLLPLLLFSEWYVCFRLCVFHCLPVCESVCMCVASLFSYLSPHTSPF